MANPSPQPIRFKRGAEIAAKVRDIAAQHRGIRVNESNMTCTVSCVSEAQMREVDQALLDAGLRTARHGRYVWTLVIPKAPARVYLNIEGEKARRFSYYRLNHGREIQN